MMPIRELFVNYIRTDDVLPTMRLVSDRETLEAIWEKNPLLRSYLGSIDNPELIVYRIDPQRVRYMQEWALNYYEVPL